MNKILQKSIKERRQDCDEITNRNNLLSSLVNFNQVDSSIVQTFSNLLNDKNKSQFSLEPVESNSLLFTINHTNPQLVQIKGSLMTFQNGIIYMLNDSGLSYFITNTQIDEELQNEKLSNKFLNDTK